MTSDTKVWRLAIAANKYMGLIPGSLEFFQTNFLGRPMVDRWVPPAVSVSNKSKPLADFLSWMIAAPVVSERAAISLAVFASSFELLPLIELRGKNYFALNVLEVLNDVLDRDASEIDYFSDGTPMNLRTASFQVVPVLPIFKVGISKTHVFPDIFVTRKFANILIENGLTGCRLIDPQVDRFAASLRGTPLPNMVEGIKI
ncbi:hypothetical protein [Undibacterium terreum]|uniref:hypothetical protein n=1 Tax=Undibacterium terreum TaxID=1224302 RepID=UPI00166B1E65|nr:hypothetical protein [Undibacterium terreum]